LYQLHWPERKVPKFGKLDFEYDPYDNEWIQIEEVLDNLNNLIKSGKIRYVGLSNETSWGVMKFLQVAKEKNLPRMMSIQNVYSLVNRVFDIANSEVSIRENCGLLAYSPLAGGRLSGKYINQQPKNARYTLWPSRFDRHHTKRGEMAIAKYVSLAKKYNITPSTFANAYVNDRPFVTSNIIGATTIEQLRENIDSIDITLSNEILHEIEDIHLSDPNPCV
jgi:aryl-alcohol dehydrogenase-like predicted oxidoreductase